MVFENYPIPMIFGPYKLDYIELLLTQPEVLKSLTSDEKDELLLEARKIIS